MVARGDPALSKPAFVRSEDGRDQMPSGPEDLGVAAVSLKGQGHYNCASASGSMQFSPPLTTNANGTAIARVAITPEAVPGEIRRLRQ
jgi:hypothetical protein